MTGSAGNRLTRPGHKWTDGEMKARGNDQNQLWQQLPDGALDLENRVSHLTHSEFVTAANPADSSANRKGSTIRSTSGRISSSSGCGITPKYKQKNIIGASIIPSRHAQVSNGLMRMMGLFQRSEECLLQKGQQVPRTEDHTECPDHCKNRLC
jgi:hypothetical protein